MSEEQLEHQVRIEGHHLGTKVSCRCGFAFVTPSAEAAIAAASSHLEAHPATPAPAAPAGGPVPRDPAPLPHFEALWARAAWPTTAPVGREPTVREAAIASVEVNHLSRYGCAHTEEIAEDVDAVLVHVARYYGRRS